MKIRFYQIYSVNGVDGQKSQLKVVNVTHLVSVRKALPQNNKKPELYLDNVLVPPFKPDYCFTYLGCHFDFKMSDDKHKSELIETITDQIEIKDKLPLHPKSD